ncbi:hypothetical protein BD309DRAFT_1071116 [Dichomitus squalens]|uniref:Uncharacterized protein n=1 Tax=Dichomitus squalens TaxID=114155 RepID=A0A4Q9NY88_9APHY|nr:hypothetical protein BD309DRAFT_1071116 [Dichomitus squalens]TBU61439.1 hypothetical protein BD310DRAFT_995268 [Dichomitus squalens]
MGSGEVAENPWSTWRPVAYDMRSGRRWSVCNVPMKLVFICVRGQLRTPSSQSSVPVSRKKERSRSPRHPHMKTPSLPLGQGLLHFTQEEPHVPTLLSSAAVLVVYALTIARCFSQPAQRGCECPPNSAQSTLQPPRYHCSRFSDRGQCEISQNGRESCPGGPRLESDGVPEGVVLETFACARRVSR